MKKCLLLCVLAISGVSLIAQISLLRSDFVDVNDSIPRIYYAFEDDLSSIHRDSIMPVDTIFDDPSEFPVVLLDTLRYFPSSETDTELLFMDATCGFNTRDGYVMHIKITDTNVELIGMQGELPFVNQTMNLKFVDNLIMTEFPAEYNDHSTDQGVGFEKQPLSLFEEAIGSENYTSLAALFDTVRFFMDIKINTTFDEYGDMQFVGDSNQNGTFQYLRENRKMMTSFDIQLRNKYLGSYTSIGDIEAIASMLPMAIPLIDTAYTHSYWTNGWKSPMLEIEYNTAYDSIHNMTFRYAFLSYVNTAISSNLKVYPNPTTEFVNFVFDNSNDYSLFVFSADGRLVSAVKFDSDNVELDVRNFKPGTYIYQIFDKNKIPVAGGKFLKN